MRRQDDTLGVISGALTNLASQAGLIGHEVGEQSEYVFLSRSLLSLSLFTNEISRMLDDLSTRVDNTDTRLRKVQRTMNDFIRRNEGTSYTCVLADPPRDEEWMVYMYLNIRAYCIARAGHYNMMYTLSFTVVRYRV